MEISIDKLSVIMTSEEYPYSIISYFPRDCSDFESYDFWECKRKVHSIKEKLKEVVINQQLLSFTTNPKTGDIVEIECDGDTDNVISWLRWKDDWYISDIKKEPVSD